MGEDVAADDTVINALRSNTKTVEFDLHATEWLHGFVSQAVTTHTGQDGSDKQQTATFTRHNATLRPATITETRGSAADLVTTLGYDASGNVTTITQDASDIAARTTTLSSFAASRYPQSITNGESETESRVYDLRFGQPTTITGVDGLNTTVQYDPFGRPQDLTQPTGRTLQLSYDALATGSTNNHPWSHQVEVLDSARPDQWITFDELGRQVRTKVEAFASGSFNYVELGYDTLGRQTKQTMPKTDGVGANVTMSYDVRDRLQSRSEPDGGSATVDYALTGSELEVTETRTIAVPGESPATEVHTVTVDALGQLTSSTDPDGTAIEYRYDGLGNVIQTEVGGNVTSIDFDGAGHRLSITEPNTGTTTFTYDAMGLLRTQLDAASRQTTFAYDKVNRLIQRIDDAGTTSENTNVWKYGASGVETGKVICESNGSGDCGTNDGAFRRDHSYDGLTGQKAATTTAINTAEVTATVTQQWSYDSAGRIDQITYTDGYTVTQAYTSTGYLDRIEDTANNLLRNFTAMTATGQVSSETLGNGIMTTRTFDPNSLRITGITTTSGTSVVQSNTYDWRSDGLLHQRTHGTLAETFSYDSLKRLMRADTAAPASRRLDYQYDVLGNLKSKTSSVDMDIDVTGYLYQDTKPNAVSAVVIGGVKHTLNYDPAGNVTSIDANDDQIPTRSFDYNSRNLATRVTVENPDNPLVPEAEDRFWYDPNGERYLKKSTWKHSTSATQGEWTSYTVYAGNLERFRLVGDPSLTEFTDTLKIGETIKRQRVVDLGGTEEIEIFYLHSDHLGSVEKVTDEDGRVHEQQFFDPFGGRRNLDWTLGITPYVVGENGRLGFTGHEQLDRTGVVHMNGRIYEPTIGRFLGADPLLHSPSYSQSYNRYSYVYNTPLSLTDPSGYEPDEEVVVTGERISPRSGGSVVTSTGTPGVGAYSARVSEQDHIGAIELITSDGYIPVVKVVGSKPANSSGGSANFYTFSGSVGWGETSAGDTIPAVKVTAQNCQGSLQCSQGPTVTGSASAAGQVFGGVFGVSVSAGLEGDYLNPNACTVVTTCIQFGLGAFIGGGASGGGGASLDALGSGKRDSWGFFGNVGAFGAAAGGSLSFGPASAAGAKGFLGAGKGASAGVQFCESSLSCLRD